MIAPITPTQRRAIVKNITAACKDINKLNETGYKFIMGCSGFIAHYNRAGFIDAHSEPGSLQNDIEASARNNQYRNFTAGDQNAEYYFSKRDTYNAILGQFCADYYAANYPN